MRFTDRKQQVQRVRKQFEPAPAWPRHLAVRRDLQRPFADPRMRFSAADWQLVNGAHLDHVRMIVAGEAALVDLALDVKLLNLGE